MTEMPSIETSDFSNNYGREKWVPLHAHDYFLTYSRCNVPKEKAMDYIIRKIKNMLEKSNNEIIFSVTAHELHEEEHESGIIDHLHIYLRFKKAQHVKTPKFFDFLYKDNNWHPSIGTVVDPIKCMRYTIGLVNKKGNTIGDIYSIGIEPIKFINDANGLNTPTSSKSIKL